MDYKVFMGSLVYGISPRKKKIRAVLKASRPSAPTECMIHYLFCGLRKASTTLFQPGGYLLYWTMGRRIISGIQTAFSQGICSSLWRYSCGRWWESFGARYSFGVGEEWRQVFCYASEALAVSKEGTGTSRCVGMWPLPLILVWVTNLWFCDRYEALNVIYSRGAQPSARFESWKLRLQPWIYELGKLCRISSQQCRRSFMFDKDSCFRETSLWQLAYSITLRFKRMEMP